MENRSAEAAGLIQAEEAVTESDVNNLMYEIESARRQIRALQFQLASKTRQVADMQNMLIEREVLLKQAASCIGEAMELSRRQAEHAEDSRKLLTGYEEAWHTLQMRLLRMQAELPEIPAAQVPSGGTGKSLDAASSRVGSRVKEARDNLKKIFED